MTTNFEFRDDMTLDLVDWMGDDQRLADAARVSTGSTNDSDKALQGLINFLMRDRHGSPFEHSVFTFYVETPIFVAREFMRHRMASYNEESGRYKELSGVFYIPNRDRKLRQEGRPAAYTYVEGSPDQHLLVEEVLKTNSIESYNRYLRLLNNNISREISRMALPLNIYTSFYVTMNARSAMNFLSLRKDEGEESYFPTNPQREIEMLAEKMSSHMWSIIPKTMGVFAKHGYIAP